MLSMKCFIIKKNLQIMYQYYNKLTKIIKKNPLFYIWFKYVYLCQDWTLFFGCNKGEGYSHLLEYIF